jgi:hypothetical protein
MADQVYYQIQILAALKEIHKELAWFRAREEAKDKAQREGLHYTPHVPHPAQAPE